MINKELYEREIRLLERMVRESSYEDPVVFYGSSSIRLWKTLELDFPQYSILNLGFGGSTLEYCNYYFERLVKPVYLSSLVLYAGDNDVGEGRNAEEILNSFTALYHKFRAFFPEAKFTYISIKPSVSRIDRIDTIIRANSLISEFLSSEDQGFFLNVFDDMVDGNLEVKKKYFTLDNLHMNSNGYQLWKKIVESCSENIFG